MSCHIHKYLVSNIRNCPYCYEDITLLAKLTKWRKEMNIKVELERLEGKRVRLHDYIIMKLDERDYHGIADAAMDLRELDARIKVLEELK